MSTRPVPPVWQLLEEVEEAAMAGGRAGGGKEGRRCHRAGGAVLTRAMTTRPVTLVELLEKVEEAAMAGGRAGGGKEGRRCHRVGGAVLTRAMTTRPVALVELLEKDAKQSPGTAVGT
eukprot:SM000031S11587  [mRNA]  locus=s31:503740:504093:+ [translate_table: standard]